MLFYIVRTSTVQQCIFIVFTEERNHRSYPTNASHHTTPHHITSHHITSHQIALHYMEWCSMTRHDIYSRIFESRLFDSFILYYCDSFHLFSFFEFLASPSLFYSNFACSSPWSGSSFNLSPHL